MWEGACIDWDDGLCLDTVGQYLRRTRTNDQLPAPMNLLMFCIDADRTLRHFTDRERSSFRQSAMLRVKHRLDRQAPPEHDSERTAQRAKSHRLLFDAYLDPNSATSLSPQGLATHWPADAAEVTGEKLKDIR